MYFHMFRPATKHGVDKLIDRERSKFNGNMLNINRSISVNDGNVFQHTSNLSLDNLKDDIETDHESNLDRCKSVTVLAATEKLQVISKY